VSRFLTASAQLGYTVKLTLVHAEKYRTEDKLKIQRIHKLNTAQKKQTTQNTAKQNYPGYVAFMTLGQETRWAYSTTFPSPHGAMDDKSFPVTDLESLVRSVTSQHAARSYAQPRILYNLSDYQSHNCLSGSLSDLLLATCCVYSYLLNHFSNLH